MSERDELAEVIRAIDGPATLGGLEVADAILAAGYRKPSPWIPADHHDGGGYKQAGPEDIAWLLQRLAKVTNQRDQARTHRRAAWDAGYAAAILDIGNEFEPSSTNPWLPGEDAPFD